jgi:hypothetical protein
MTFARLRFIVGRWVRNLVSVRALTAVLSAFGALWLLVEITAFFFQNTTVPDWLRGHWWLFAILGVGLAAARCWPKTSVACNLNGRDVIVEIAVGDVFEFSGAIVVGSNTTFDTRVSPPTLIAANSVQGRFTKTYYSDETQLDGELATGLSGVLSETLQGPRQGKAERYPIGTTVRLNPKGRRAYFVAIADINEHGVAEGSFEKLRVALAELWVHVGSRGLKEPLVMPVLGTGFSRLTQTRAEVVREIVKSFVAACSERVFADRLTIVLFPADMTKHGLSLDELGAFLKHMCVYTNFSDGSRHVAGRPA